MQARVLGLTASVFILAYGAVAAMAQDRLPTQPDQEQTQSRPMGRAMGQDMGQGMGQAMGQGMGHDEEGTTGQGGMMREGMPGRGEMGPGMMRGGMMGRGMMARGSGGGCSPVMFRILFALMDSDGDGTVSLQEFQAAHERIFKAMDANKDGQLTDDEMLAFMHGVRMSAPQQQQQQQQR